MMLPVVEEFCIIIWTWDSPLHIEGTSRIIGLIQNRLYRLYIDIEHPTTTTT